MVERDNVMRVAKAMRERALEGRDGDSILFEEFGGYGEDEDFIALALVALSADGVSNG